MLKKLFWTAAFSAFPLLMFAFSGGPPIRRTGAPADGGTDCSACHRTFAPANSDSRGFVRISAVSYTPGKKQLIRVQVYHPDAKRWGFELTARLTSDENLKAGTFTPSATVQVKCDPAGNAPCGNDREFGDIGRADLSVNHHGAAGSIVRHGAPWGSGSVETCLATEQGEEQQTGVRQVAWIGSIRQVRPVHPRARLAGAFSMV